jgi:hypothetical protein
MRLRIWEARIVMWLRDTRSIAFLDVKTRLKAILALCAGHGKSPCFSQSNLFLKLFGERENT